MLVDMPSCRFASRQGSTWRAIAIATVGLFFLPGLTRCEPWDDGPPPATAAGGATVASPDPGAVPPPPSPGAAAPADPNAPPTPPPGPPPPPPYQTDGTGETPAMGGADDGTRYASGEYAIGADDDSYDDNDPSALSDFRPALEPYGTWVDDPTYGTVWVPSADAVGPDFQPYVSAGHWAYDSDYVWVSDYPWGWAPFHYGRWVMVDGRGWSWIPGRAYRGAWVTWSVDDGYSYLGWAPLGPSFVWFGGRGVAWHGYWGPRWAYCPRGEVFAPRVGARVVVGPPAIVIAGRMRPYAPAAMRVGGPPPERLGYAVGQIPRATAAPGVTRAQEFARPSTARALGAAPPARFDSPAVRGRVGAPAAGPTRLPGAPANGEFRGPAGGELRAPATGPAYREPAGTPGPVHRST
ncbi:MAG TPA: DUF6600 domain-containing protein, partial [Polyangiaceae bacterium]|nr:DUF6600 domain-containing protein [Polyangiaceae bacterium]